MELRDPQFESSYDTFIETTLLTGPRVRKLPENEVSLQYTHCSGCGLVLSMWEPLLVA